MCSNLKLKSFRSHATHQTWLRLGGLQNAEQVRALVNIYCSMKAMHKTKNLFEQLLFTIIDRILFWTLHLGAIPSSVKKKNSQATASSHQHWPGPNFICLAWNFPLDKNRITNQISRIIKQQLNTSNKQYATNGNLVSNPVFIKEEISC